MLVSFRHFESKWKDRKSIGKDSKKMQSKKTAVNKRFPYVNSRKIHFECRDYRIIWHIFIADFINLKLNLTGFIWVDILIFLSHEELLWKTHSYQSGDPNGRVNLIRQNLSNSLNCNWHCRTFKSTLQKIWGIKNVNPLSLWPIF